MPIGLYGRRPRNDRDRSIDAGAARSRAERSLDHFSSSECVGLRREACPRAKADPSPLLSAR
jgi:hypothetical protein